MGQSFETLSQLPASFGPFTLVRLLAQGGMGQVFLALRPVEDEPTDEVCVVKTVRADLKNDREAVARFLDEARVVQKLDHAAICHTLDAGIIDKTYFLALEFISGRNLRDVQTRAQKGGREVPDVLIFHALIEVLEALHYAHALVDPSTGEHLRIVHRDVSPHNVMMGFNGYVKLIDFGLAAHELKRELTKPGIMVGKLRYNAPEQVRDRALDGRSDLYSVGVMLYELLTGERFYEGLSEEDIWRVAMKGTHRPRLLHKVPADLRPVLDRALAPTPAGRYADARQMQAALIEVMQRRQLTSLRRACRRFMTEMLAEEREEERLMILQATNLAAARTQLERPRPRRAPAQPPPPPDATFNGSVSAVGRTSIVSPAELRGRLAAIVSAVDPEVSPPPRSLAQTADDKRDTVAILDRALRPPIDREPPARPPLAPRHTAARQTPPRPLQPPLPHRAGEVRGDGRGDHRGQVDLLGNSGDDVGAHDAPAPEPRPFPPRAAVPLGMLAGAAGLLVVVIAMAALFVPALVEKGKARRTVVAAAVPVTTIARTIAVPIDDDPIVQPADDIPIEPIDVAVDVAVDAAAAGRASGAVASGRSGRDDEARLTATRSPRPRPSPGRATPEPRARDAPPPSMPLRTLKEQIDYLAAYCLDRVDCARTVRASAERLIALSPKETKALMQEIPRCIDRCRR